MAGKPRPAPTPVEVKKPQPRPVPVLKKKLPGPRELGPELNMKHWKVQCSNTDLAMLCRMPDRSERRCAAKRKGRYRWTYASFCHAALPCYRKACPE